MKRSLLKTTICDVGNIIIIININIIILLLTNITEFNDKNAIAGSTVILSKDQSLNSRVFKALKNMTFMDRTNWKRRGRVVRDIKHCLTIIYFRVPGRSESRTKSGVDIP